MLHVTCYENSVYKLCRFLSEKKYVKHKFLVLFIYKIYLANNFKKIFKKDLNQITGQEQNFKKMQTINHPNSKK